MRRLFRKAVRVYTRLYRQTRRLFLKMARRWKIYFPNLQGMDLERMREFREKLAILLIPSLLFVAVTTDFVRAEDAPLPAAETSETATTPETPPADTSPQSSETAGAPESAAPDPAVSNVAEEAPLAGS
ncbi:MAG TPA: hypothetical protein DEP25_04045, partial [Candidatus Taylorbacteria bacterium]|nr:hypothetical protein [Candidatus Taylorbacteria bacterium]